MIRNIPPKDVKSLIEKGEAVLIDVREKSESDECRIEEAKLMPVDSISPENLAQFGGKKIIFHCNGGGRGSRTCDKFSATFDTYNLEGGIRSWEASGLKVRRNSLR